MTESKTSYLVLGMAFALFLSAAFASQPVSIEGVSVSTEQDREILNILLNIPAQCKETPVFHDRVFPHAGYGCLEFPHAVLAGGERSLKVEGDILENVRLDHQQVKEVACTRVLFYLKKWTPHIVEQEGETVRVIFSEKSGNPVAPGSTMLFSLNPSSPESLAIGNAGDDMDKFMEGVEVENQPVIMAQAGQQQINPSQPSTFYVPPSEREETSTQTPGIPREDIFSQLVTLRFKDADLQNVIRLIAQKTGLNVIMARDQVAGTITVNLEDVPLGAALDAILKTHGLAFVRETGDIVRIVPRSEIQAAEIELKTVHVPVNWVPASKLAETLRPFLSSAEGAQIQPDSESNALIITDTPPNVETLILLEEKLDVPEKQVMIEMRLVDMGKNILRQIGSSWQLDQSIEPTRKPIFEEIIDPITGNVIGLTPTGEYDTIPSDKIADTFAHLAELGTAGGSKWNWAKTLTILGSDFDFDLFVEAYGQRGLIEVLANPKIITLNNVQATIEIIEEIPYTDTVIGSGGSQSIQAEFKEAGIIMQVTPYITNNGYVRMTLKPEQMIFRGREPFAGNTPIVDRRTAETNVIVRDEETVVLGGLRQATNIKRNSGTPWFMEIPIIGWLFKSDSKEGSQLEMVMFVTPHIIKEPALTEMEKMQYERIDYGWDLPEEFFKTMRGDTDRE